jgi:hypothetical protein
MNRFLLLLAGLIFASYSLGAQTDQPPTDRTFRIFSVVHSFPDLRLDVSGSRTIRVDIQRNLSDAYPCPTGATLALYREIPPPSDAPAGTPPRKEMMLQAALPADLPRVIVIVAPGRNDQLSAIVLDDNPAKHARGELRMVNLSRQQAALMINSQSYSLDSGASKLMPYTSGNVLIRMAVLTAGSQWALAYSKERIARPDVRAYGFIFDYMADPEVEGDGAPPPALVRFFTERVLDPGSSAKK